MLYPKRFATGESRKKQEGIVRLIKLIVMVERGAVQIVL